MYNADLPTRAELPAMAQLLRSTLVAVVTAGALLVAFVLPAEYGIDPTGVGRALQLTEMGAIKQKLAKEASADTQAVAKEVAKAPAPAIEPMPAPAQEAAAEPPAVVAAPVPIAEAPTPPTSGRKDEMTVTLKPDQGAEIKMQMKKGAQANYSWMIDGGVVNFDEHGDGAGDNAISYEKGRAVANKEGVLEAAFDGIHGWYWRNRGKADVTVTLRTDGDYAAIQRME